MDIIRAVYNCLWGDLVKFPLPGGSTVGISLLVLILVPTGIYFTVRTRFVLVRMFRIATEKRGTSQKGSISGLQALIPASNEPSAVLARAFGECREGHIPRCSAALQD